MCHERLDNGLQLSSDRFAVLLVVTSVVAQQTTGVLFRDLVAESQRTNQQWQIDATLWIHHVCLRHVEVVFAVVCCLFNDVSLVVDRLYAFLGWLIVCLLLNG